MGNLSSLKTLIEYVQSTSEDSVGIRNVQACALNRKATCCSGT